MSSALISGGEPAAEAVASACNTRSWFLRASSRREAGSRTTAGATARAPAVAAAVPTDLIDDSLVGADAAATTSAAS